MMGLAVVFYQIGQVLLPETCTATGNRYGTFLVEQVEAVVTAHKRHPHSCSARPAWQDEVVICNNNKAQKYMQRASRAQSPGQTVQSKMTRVATSGAFSFR
jgi:hypothetical protein